MDEKDAEVYLVVREGNRWRDIFRLVPGAVVTVGRDNSNRVVLRDELCSRRHCTLYQDQSAWVIRDLASRNGTIVNGVRVHEICPLEEGDSIRIGASELLLTSDISGPLDGPALGDPLPARETGAIRLGEDDSVAPSILDRKSRTGFVTENNLATERGRTAGVREVFATLYRLIVGMIASSGRKELCETVLNGLLPAAGADIGAVLLFPPGAADRADPNQLHIVSYSAPPEWPYRRVSTKLSSRVLQDREALLATGITHDSLQGEFGTLHEMEAKSVICAPIRGSDHLHGLLHLYSLRSDR